MNRILAAVGAAALLLTPLAASAQEGTKLGVLDCTVEGGFGLLVGSSKPLACSFTHEDGTTEVYVGQIDKLGIDVGVTGKQVMQWLVWTPVGNEPGDFSLAGQYVGGSAEASLGIGLGANALVGGSDRKIGLQPVSVTAGTGVNFAVGLTSLTLQPAG